MKKTATLLEIANRLQKEENIPRDLAGLTSLPGIGRKSANVIIRESGDTAEGLIVDLHVLRVAPRLGIAEMTDKPKPEKVEKQIMDKLPQDQWNQAGMALSFLGREICRPTDPKCDICVMNSVCRFYRALKS